MPSEIVARHHEEQRLIVRNMVAELQVLWGILDFHDLNSTTADWLKAVRPVVERGYLTSQYVAARFYNSHRAASLPSAPPMNLDLPNPLGFFGTSMIPDRDTQLRIMVSMKVTGPGHLYKLMPMDEAEAMEKAFSKSSGAATRIALNGGRGMVVAAANADPHARGVVGVAGENSCESCSFLASRPILKTEGLKKMGAVAVGHDFCTCSAAPIF